MKVIVGLLSESCDVWEDFGVMHTENSLIETQLRSHIEAEHVDVPHQELYNLF